MISRGEIPGRIEIREAGPDEAATLFIVHAAVEPADAGHLLEWTRQLEERLERGGRAWLAFRGQQATGYALIDPLPGLPGVVDMTGGIIPAWQRQGIGSALLIEIAGATREAGCRQLSCRVENLGDGMASFLLRRGFNVEHEECLLQLSDLSQLPSIPASLPGKIVTYTRHRAVVEFCQLYERSFTGLPWSQPYTETEVDSILSRTEDLLFLENAQETIGVAWLEDLGDGQGRIEPLGIAQKHQGKGYGRRLLLAALDEFRRRQVRLVEIGLWRDNTAAMHLYQSLGFSEVANWYYLARDLTPTV